MRKSHFEPCVLEGNSFCLFSLLVCLDLPISAPAGDSLRENNADEDAARNQEGHQLGLNKDKYNMYEMMFNMERGGCAVAQANQDNPGRNPKCDAMKTAKQDDVVKKSAVDPKDAGKDDAAAAKNCPPPDTSKTGLAPWQEGVLERLGKELTPQEYNMYVVHHGRMLVSFGQIKACTPREDDFVYGSLEPIPVQTLRSFKVTTSNNSQMLFASKLKNEY